MGISCSRSAAHVWPSPEPVKSLCTLNSFQIIPALCRNWTSNLHQPQLFYNFLEEYHSKGLLFSPLPPAVCLILLQLKFMYLPKGVYSHPSLPCTQRGGVGGNSWLPTAHPCVTASLSSPTAQAKSVGEALSLVLAQPDTRAKVSGSKDTQGRQFPGASGGSDCSPASRGRKTPSQSRWNHKWSFQAHCCGMWWLQTGLFTMSLSLALPCVSEVTAGRDGQGTPVP